MPKLKCRRQVVVSVVAFVAWASVAWMCAFPPGPTDELRLPYFAVLGLAIGATSLAALPWLMAGFIEGQVLAYVAGYMHREADEQAERPALSVVR